MSFMMITDSDGYEWIVNRRHVVLMEPFGNNEWEKGGRLCLERGSCERNVFELDYDSTMAVREWLLTA
ncbi:TPA: hypothetical protein RH941_000544 [Pseudomonas aeruginosa]|uniref:hypothetical protein n=1 Tax=Pseudomonas aeruginosa TaxID=287 RepID=UPI0020767AA3|nr:hypothetical protein [Pseudomonas aeruginosa]MCM8572344.1 hypothetical protein [Pseudomonas aeruginosa]HDV4106875.1 hypothetical protein [Pseudomonas aeruginosa]HDV4161326.1 hypothetical protein [Pseudomonas aeruginosa]HDV4174465.1 hypothetical protein [Pseudomonas aeruginosa]HDV4193094.1 hypothetical protein [Pseudomonas aeruginosa]